MDADHQALVGAFESLVARLTGSAVTINEPPTLAHLAAGLGLTEFERLTLLLCAGAELDRNVATVCGLPTFGFALERLPGGHLSALAPSRPLRRFELLALGSGNGLVGRTLHIDERILHFLLGLSVQAPAPARALESVPLAPSHVAVAQHVGDLVARGTGIMLTGASRSERRAVATAAVRSLGIELYELDATELPLPVERDRHARMWEREAALGEALLLVDADGADPRELRAAVQLLERIDAPRLASASELLDTDALVAVSVPGTTVADRHAAWRDLAGGAPSPELDQVLHRLARDFATPPSRMEVAFATASDASTLRDQVRLHNRPHVGELATRVKSRSRWDDLVAPSDTVARLRELVAHVRTRHEVDAWGVGGPRAALGVAALFAGPSGTGKSLAAEILANELELDLYRIDLSRVISKWIGETEKNLSRVFEAAESSGAVLLFDEADALFGKRTDVKDSHDRHANVEVSYLLARMEAYGGLAILTTNRRDAVDEAFIRRLRFVVEFPFPGEDDRKVLWQRLLGDGAPRGTIDWDQLACIQLAGGGIRNGVIHAAALSADSGELLSTAHMLAGARLELEKLDRRA